MRNLLVLVFFSVPFLLACVNTKKARYFTNLSDSSFFQTSPVPEQIIQKNDLLSISVSSINPKADEMFNMPNNPEVQAATTTGETLRPAGYLVNVDGNIRFPMLGIIKAENLTKLQLQENIRNALVERKLLLDPVINVRFLNFKVTVLGEVTRPTVITVANEKITLLEALGLAGDLTIFGKRDNVLVIRESGERKVSARINLNSNELLTSPYYYLQSNDVIYVEPNRARITASTGFNQLIPILVSGLTAFVFIIDRISR